MQSSTLGAWSSFAVSLIAGAATVIWPESPIPWIILVAGVMILMCSVGAWVCSNTKASDWILEWFWTGAPNRAHPRDVTSQARNEVFPDWPIHELFYHLRPDLAGKNSLIWQTVGEKVRDVFANDKDDFLIVRGRPLVKTVPDIFFPERPALQKIEHTYWASADFTYWFLNKGDARQKHASGTSGEYTDIRVNKKRALEIWPERLSGADELQWPDFDRWDKEDVFRLFEAACLWKDIEPRLPLDSEANAIFRRLRRAIYSQELAPYMDTKEAAAAWNAVVTQEFERDDAITVNTKVKRYSLLEFAQEEGDRPRFLYPGARA